MSSRLKTRKVVKTVMTGRVMMKSLIGSVFGRTVCIPKMLVQKVRGKNNKFIYVSSLMLSPCRTAVRLSKSDEAPNN